MWESAITLALVCYSRVCGMDIEGLRQKGRRLRTEKEEQPSNVVLLDTHRTRKPAPDKKGVFPHMNSKFTPEVTDLIIAAVRAGNYFTTSAALAGIHEGTLYRWLREGEEDEDSKYRQFALDMATAEAEAEISVVSVIRAAASDDYRAGLELLSRRFPERWSTRNRTELTGTHGAPIEVVVSYEDEAEDAG